MIKWVENYWRSNKPFYIPQGWWQLRGWSLPQVWLCDHLFVSCRPGPKLMTDTQHSTLNTPCIWMGIPARRMWIHPHFKISHSNTWIWCWSLKCRVLINRHKFRAWTQNLWWIPRTLHSGFTLHTQDSPIHIHWVLSVECWVSVISLGPLYIIMACSLWGVAQPCSLRTHSPSPQSQSW